MPKSLQNKIAKLSVNASKTKLRDHTCNIVMDPLSWLISYTSEPAVTAAILITSDPVISRDAQIDRTPRSRGGTVACGRGVATVER